MAEGSGTNVLIGMRKGATWGTAVAASAATYGIRCTAFNWKDNVEDLPDMGFNGSPLENESAMTGLYKIGGKLTIDMIYQGRELPFAAFFGTAGVPATTGSFYTHTFSPKTDMSGGRFVTLVWYDGIVTHEVDSVRFTELELKSSSAKTLTAEFTWEGRKRSENTATNANVTSLTEPSTFDRVQMNAAYVTYTMAAQASSLAAQEICDWSTKFARAYDDDVLGSSSLHAPYRRESKPGAFTYSGQITVPYSATTYLAAMLSGALYKLKLYHSLVSVTKEMGIWLPSIKFRDSDLNAKGKGGIPGVFGWDGKLAATAPSGMTLANPYVTLINALSTDPLA